ncbi:MAG: gliding motility-associated C-terminal domain-containing protein [Bacteroidales bacterium]|jgi:hypothetical protein|nr:gliding motility-associated C-terminal domain-containing protein [Bacteroidales bacterium]
MSKINILPVFILLFTFTCAQQIVVSQAVAAYKAVSEEAEIAAIKPLSIIYSSNVVCVGDTVFLTKNDSLLGTIINKVYVWNINGVEYSKQPQAAYCPQQEVTSVILYIYSDAALVASDTAYLYMTQKPATTVKHDTICYGDEAFVAVYGGKWWYWSYWSWITGQILHQTSQDINIRPFYITPYVVFSSEYPVHTTGYINTCYTVDTAWVIVHRDVNIPISGDTIVCSGTEHEYGVKSASTVVWWDGNTENPRSMVINSDTTLSYTGTSVNGCGMSGTLSVKVVANSEGGIEGDDSYCIGDTVVLFVETLAPKIKWFNGDTSMETRFTANVSFTAYCQIYAGDDEVNCTKRLEYPVEVKECISMFFPSGFKPDGVTSTYGPIGVIDPLKKYEFSIYNCVGERIFETKDLNIKWDGRIKGKDAPAGVYIYQYRETVERFTFEKRGTFTIVR